MILPGARLIGTGSGVGLPGDSDGRESTCCADVGSMHGSGRSLGGEHGNALQYSCLETPMDGGAWRATVHRVAKSWARPGTSATWSSWNKEGHEGEGGPRRRWGWMSAPGVGPVQGAATGEGVLRGGTLTVLGA